jgi:hypothetical protein
VPEDELLDALRGLGADHEPDVTAIRRRMEEKRPTVIPLRRRVEEVPRRRPVLLSAAAAILIGGGVTVAVSQMGPADNASPANRIPVTVPIIESPSSDAGTPTPDPGRTTAKHSKESTPDGVNTSKAGTGKTKGSDPTANQNQPSSTQGPKSPPASTGSSAVLAATGSVAALTQGQSLSLSSANEDWLAIGTRNDLKTVRSKAASASPLLNFTAPASGASVDGPLQVSWNGGVPEQDRANDTHWLQTDGAVVTVMASPAARTVTLYVGNLMDVKVSGQDLKDYLVTLDGSAPAYAVTVSIPSHAGDTTIALQSDRGPVHLAAAVASSS